MNLYKPAEEHTLRCTNWENILQTRRCQAVSARQEIAFFTMLSRSLHPDERLCRGPGGRIAKRKMTASVGSSTEVASETCGRPNTRSKDEADEELCRRVFFVNYTAPQLPQLDEGKCIVGYRVHASHL